MKKVLLALFITCVVVTSIWFLRGYILGTGESGLPFYLPTKHLQTNLHTWTHDITGNMNPSGVASIPWYSLMSASYAVFGSTATQALFFLGLLLMMSLGMVWLMYEVLKVRDSRAIFIGGLFYIANTITLSQVFNRFQYPFMLTYAFLPIWITLLHMVMQRFSIKRLTVILSVSATVSMIFASPPMALILVIASVTYIGYILIQNRQFPHVLRDTLLKASITGLSLILVHAWWILPFIKILPNTQHLTQEQYSQEGNIWTFHELSDRLGDPLYVLRMQNKEFYLNPPPLWGNNYQSLVFILISLAPIVAVGFSLHKSIKFERKGLLITLFAVSVVLTMGSNPPFGFINTILIENIRLFETFRNPYEKASLLIPLSVAPIVGIVLSQLSHWLANRTNSKTGTFALVVATMLLCGVYVYPFWTGLVFTSSIPPSNNPDVGFSVKVPDDYADLRAFLSEEYQQEFFRVLFLPIGGEGITYNWPIGYSGIELSNDLLNIPAISMSTGGVQFLPEIVNQIEKSLIDRPGSFKNVLADLRVRYVVIRADVDEVVRGLTSNTIIAQKIDQIPELKKIAQFGKLSVFELDPVSRKELITASSSVVSANMPTGNIFRKHLLDQESSLPDSIFNDLQQTSLDSQHLLTLKLKRGLNVSELINRRLSIYSGIKDMELRSELPYLAVHRNNVLHPLVKLKEKISLQFANPYQKEELYFTYSAKRLHEAITASDQQDKKNALSEYIVTLDLINAESAVENNAKIRKILVQKILLEQLSKHDTIYIEANKSIDAFFERGEQSVKYRHADGVYERANFSLPTDIDAELVVEGCSNPVIDINSISVPLISVSGNSSQALVRLQKGDNAIELINSADNGICHIYIYEQGYPNLNTQNPEITQILEKSPAHYQIYITNATQPYLLTFAETFHPLWQAKIVNQNNLAHQHILVNDFSNGWIIDAKGNYVIELSFQGEQYYKVGTIITIFTLSTIILLNMYQKKHDSLFKN